MHSARRPACRRAKAGSRRAGTPRRKQSIFGACPSAGFAGSVCRAQNRARGVPGQKKLQDVEELEEEITEGMQIVFAGSISDVLKEALVQK